MCKIGFTGTRNGMSSAQKKAFYEFMAQKDIGEFHHGDCVGSDQEAHVLIDALRKKKNLDIKIIGHPPKFTKYRAYCQFDITTKTDDYIKRNRDIVDATDFLVATPDAPEKTHSGTWSTVRYARSQNKRIYIIHKSGRITIDEKVLLPQQRQ